MSLNIRNIRVPYRHDKDTFDSIDLKFKEPLAQFKVWFTEAVDSGKVYEANAMALATSTKSGIPSVRYMLLKDVDERGFHFFSNYNSRKGRELDENPNASLLFYWEALNRQVRHLYTESMLYSQYVFTLVYLVGLSHWFKRFLCALNNY
ncbi:unnamed protein product [Echinostoma caproni]|uniref:pyridoxal 5'-phosphate synthase n=1 Tax=Echinostoma caproni TaxID=27848 RepID=A0A183BFS4_9TREM|nr:unnamed protein product [Echinostoma caproni]